MVVILLHVIQLTVLWDPQLGPRAKPEGPQLLDDPKIKEIAQTYSKTPAQVVRYRIQLDLIGIPKAVNKARIQQNFDMWDFKLSAEDTEHLETFDCSGRIYPYEDAYDHKDHPCIRNEY